MSSVTYFCRKNHNGFLDHAPGNVGAFVHQGIGHDLAVARNTKDRAGRQRGAQHMEVAEIFFRLGKPAARTMWLPSGSARNGNCAQRSSFAMSAVGYVYSTCGPTRWFWVKGDTYKVHYRHAKHHRPTVLWIGDAWRGGRLAGRFLLRTRSRSCPCTRQRTSRHVHAISTRPRHSQAHSSQNAWPSTNPPLVTRLPKHIGACASSAYGPRSCHASSPVLGPAQGGR